MAVPVAEAEPDPAVRERPTALGPGGERLSRPRRFAAAAALVAVVFTSLVMLSDRAPGILQRIAERIDAEVAAVALIGAHSVVDESDFQIHIGVWAAITVLVGLASWSWPSLLGGAGIVFAYSLALEVAQEMLSSTRAAQAADVLGNLIGVAAGLVAVAAGAGANRLRRRRAESRA